MAKLLGVELTPLNVAVAAVALPGTYLAYRSIKATKATVDAAGQFIDRRVNDANVFESVANGVTEIVTLDKNQTLGGAVFDLLNNVDVNRPDAVRGPLDRLKAFFGFGSSASPGDVLEPIVVTAQRIGG